jgi:hypothetical protein
MRATGGHGAERDGAERDGDLGAAEHKHGLLQDSIRKADTETGCETEQSPLG